jgi:hypothetical protein
VKLTRTRLAGLIVLASISAGVVPLTQRGGLPAAQAQNLGQRSVSGAVVDAESKPVPSATVFLKNQKTKAIRSYTSARDGRFYFAQVNMAEDFDLWAEKEGKKSAVKTVSSWDARKEFETELKMK